MEDSFNIICLQDIGGGKVAIVMIMMAIAIKMYRAKYQRWTMVPCLFILYIITVSLSFDPNIVLI